MRNSQWVRKSYLKATGASCAPECIDNMKPSGTSAHRYVVLKLELASESLKGLLKLRMLSCILSFSRSGAGSDNMHL